MSRWIALLAALGGLSVSCGSSDESSGGGAGAGGTNIGQPGCTTAPDCGACDGCYSKCLCSTGNDAACLNACGLTGGQGGSGGGVGGSGQGGVGGGGPAELPLAGGLRITEVSVYQSLKIPIMQNGTEVFPGTRNAPIVAGKPAVIRVFITPDPTFQPRSIVARLELVSSANPGFQDIPKFVNAPSSETDWQSAFNFDIPGEFVTTDLQYAVTLFEGESPTSVGDAGGSRFPAQLGANLGAEEANGTFKVMLVPVISNGITPDVSPARIQQYHDRLYALYPAPEIEINVRQPIAGPSVSGQGGGWSQLLNFVLNLRQQDNVPRDVYYYGVVTPTTSFGSYCNFGCVAGLGTVPSAGDDYGRGSCGLGFFPSGGGGDSPDTMAHEVGHSLGRPHAPCQVQDAPPGFPYPGGGIGVWGYDLLKNQLKSPNSHKDIMGYCDPSWISDHNYVRLFDRISFVNATGYIEPPSSEGFGAGRYRVAIVEQDGSLTWGEPVDMRSAPMGDIKDVELRDENGQVTGSARGVFYPLTHLDGGMLLVPETALSASPGTFSMKPIGVGALGSLPL